MKKAKIEQLKDILAYRQYRDNCMRATNQFKGFLIDLGEMQMEGTTSTDNLNLTPARRLKRTVATTPALTTYQKKPENTNTTNLEFPVNVIYTASNFINEGGNTLDPVEYKTSEVVHFPSISNYITWRRTYCPGIMLILKEPSNKSTCFRCGNRYRAMAKCRFCGIVACYNRKPDKDNNDARVIECPKAKGERNKFLPPVFVHFPDPKDSTKTTTYHNSCFSVMHEQGYQNFEKERIQTMLSNRAEVQK